MTLPSSPGKMDLSALGGLKKRAPLQSVPDAPQEAPVVTQEPPQAVPVAAEAPKSTEPSGAVDTALETAVSDAVEPQSAAVSVEGPAKIEPAAEEHSGHVTLYLPGALNRWLAEHHDSTDVSYPGIVLNAISWAAAENRMAGIFAPVDSPIPANDIFGRAPAIAKPVRGDIEPETRPLRFQKDHMRVIISLARTWTADNRNAFFVGVLSAYRDDQTQSKETA